MLHFLGRRLALALLVVWGVLTGVFLLMRVVPGDPAQLLMGTDATPEMVEPARVQMGLDRPLPEQYLTFLRNVLQGDFGQSLYMRTPVSRVLMERLPAFGRGGLEHLVMPAITLGFSFTGLLVRLIRAGVLEVKFLDYIRTARAKGLPERAVVRHHLLKNMMIPVTTVMGLQIGQLLAGAIVVETVFAWPGWGQLVADSIAYRDYTLAQGVTVAIAVTFVAVNLLVDVLYAYLDPRIRLQ